MKTFKSLNIFYLIKTSLQLCRSNDLSWDARRDIAFLAMFYGKEIEGFRQQLNQKELQDLFFSTSYFSKLAPEDQRKCTLALLGRDIPPMPRSAPPTAGALPKPPTQALSAPHSSQRLSATSSQAARPVLISHQSTPHLKQVSTPSIPTTSPPLHNNTRGPLHNRAASINSPPMPLPYAGVSNRSQMAPTNATGREQYVRYHTVSAGNTPNLSTHTSRDVSPQLLPSNPVRPSSSESRLPSQQSNGQPMALPNSIPIPPNFSRNARPTLQQGLSPKQSMPSMAISHGRQPARVFGPHPSQSGVSISLNNTQPAGAPLASAGGRNSGPQRWHQEQLYDSRTQPFPNPVAGGSQSSGLRLVGPGGLYPSAPKPTSTTPQGLAAQVKDGRKSPQLVHAALAAPQSAAVFELPATSTPAPIMPQELPAMPVSPITPEATPHIYQPGDVSPLKPHSQNTLAPGLPASLMIGGPAAHHRQRTPPQSQPSSVQTFPTQQADSSSFQQSSGTAYQAYAGLISPPLQPAGPTSNYAPVAKLEHRYAQTPFPGETKQTALAKFVDQPATSYVAYAAPSQQQGPILRKPTPDHPQPLKIAKGSLPTPPPTAVPNTYETNPYAAHTTSNTQNGEDVLAETMTVVNTQLNAQQQSSYITNYNYYDETSAPYYPSPPTDSPHKDQEMDRRDKTMSQASLSSVDPESAYPESEVEIRDAWTQIHSKPTTAATVVTTSTSSISTTKTATALPALSTDSAAALANEYSLYSGVNNIHAMLASPNSPLAGQKAFYDGEFEWEDEEEDLSKPYRMATVRRGGNVERVKVARGKHNFGH
ncbi:hypothetical protein BDV96DRAFT_203522 [Lophiotrema nucula]|uniref:Uncharacterized protein n=1 Tax=Lophiotrema nucula TaxID=690887 RepID=A0A6A5ZN80_9PLEO|nr:hypothetical protein BDV96DRAFT_203522 [Lophiotrema nucula]